MPAPRPILQSTCPANPRPFLSLPDVIRERIYYYVLLVEVDLLAPWVTPLPTFKQTPRCLPGLPPEPDRNLDGVSKRVRKKRRRRTRAWEQIKQDITVQVQAAAPPSCLALLETCRTILLEAFHLWYKYNTLNFTSSENLYSFLVSVGRARANEIRSIRLDLPAREWDDPKARRALGRLLRLGKLIFIYNNISPLYDIHSNISCIGYPKIINQLKGLQDVTFADPEQDRYRARQWGGLKFGMTEGVRRRMEQLREKMMEERKKAMPPSPMVDLFSRLKPKDQVRNDTVCWGWEGGLSYAPEADGGG